MPSQSDRTKSARNAGSKPRTRPAGKAGVERELARLRQENSRLKAALRAARVRRTLLAKGQDSAIRPQTTLRAPDELPPLPSADAEGYYPAVEFAYVSIARTIIERRKAAGWSQGELAARAGVRLETVNRLESGRHSPNVRTVDKIASAFKAARV